MISNLVTHYFYNCFAYISIIGKFILQDVLEWVRKDYRNNANIPNSQEDQIKSLLKYGDKMLKELKQNVDLATAS